ncbi:MAG: hypothetical protein R3C14_40505 [Caldilineaceae bacterium]
MNIPVIHFNDLAAFLAEYQRCTTGADPRPLICIATTNARRTVQGAHFPTTTHTIALDMRAPTPNKVIICYRPLATQIVANVMTEHNDPSPQQQYDQAWDTTEKKAAALRNWIAAQGYPVASAVLDIRDAHSPLGAPLPQSI